MKGGELEMKKPVNNHTTNYPQDEVINYYGMCESANTVVCYMCYGGGNGNMPGPTPPGPTPGWN